MLEQKERMMMEDNLRLHKLQCWSTAHPNPPTSRCPATATLSPTKSLSSARTTRASDLSSSPLKTSLRLEVRNDFQSCSPLASPSHPTPFLELFASLLTASDVQLQTHNIVENVAENLHYVFNPVAWRCDMLYNAIAIIKSKLAYLYEV